jgi:hypothetical protein
VGKWADPQNTQKAESEPSVTQNKGDELSLRFSIGNHYVLTSWQLKLFVRGCHFSKEDIRSYLTWFGTYISPIFRRKSIS